MSEEQIRASLRVRLPLISNTAVQQEVARYLGMQSFLRRPVAPRLRPDATPLAEFDHIVSGDNILSISGEQDTPTIAVNPVDPNIVVVVGHNNQSYSASDPQDCSIYVSFDGGVTYTYSADADLTVFTAPHFCSDPVARFSPDGNDLYLAYLVTQGGTLAQAVSLADYNGFDPTTALPQRRVDTPVSAAPDLLESPWLDVHTFDPDPFAMDTGVGYVYLTYLSQHAVGCDVTFAGSSNRATSFDIGPIVLATSDTCATTTGRSLKGPRPAAGPKHQVLVCWFDAGIDGYSTASTANPNPPPLNKFNIACRSSNDRGSTFSGGTAPPEANPPDPARWIYAAKNVANEVAYYVPPAAAHVNGLFKLANAQFPALTIDHLGNAHIVFSFNPTTNALGADQANVGYVKSTASAPTATVPTIYSKWSARSIVASGPGAQIFPTITAQRVWESTKPYIYVGWIDTAVSSKLGPAYANAVYEAKYRVSVTGGPSFGKTVVVTDHASLSDFTTIGDYIDSTANNGLFHIAWTDNRFGIDILRPREHLFADRF
jgi:hypothetical protein